MSRKRKLDSYHCRESGEVNQSVIDDALALWVSTLIDNDPISMRSTINPLSTVQNQTIEDWLESIGHRLPLLVIGWMQKTVKNVPQFVRLWRISCAGYDCNMDSSFMTEGNILEKFSKQFQPSDVSELIICISQDQRLQTGRWGMCNGIWWRLSLRTFPFFGTTQNPDSSANAWFQWHLNRLGLLGRKRKTNQIHVLEALARAPTFQQLLQDLTDLSSLNFSFSEESLLKFFSTCTRCSNIFPVREKWMPASHAKILPFNEFVITLLQFLWTHDHMIIRGPDKAHASLETISDTISIHVLFGTATEFATGHDQSYIFGKLTCIENDFIQPTETDLQMVQLILAFAARSQHPTSWARAMFPNWYVYYHIFRESQWWFPALQILQSPDTKFPPCSCRHHLLDHPHAYSSSHTYPCSSDQEFSMSSKPFFRPVDDPATAAGYMKKSVLYLQQTKPRTQAHDLLKTGVTVALTHLILLLNVYGVERSKAIRAMMLTEIIKTTNSLTSVDYLWKHILRVAEPMIQQWFSREKQRERKEDRRIDNNMPWFLHQSPSNAKFCYWLQDRHNIDGLETIELKMIYRLLSAFFSGGDEGVVHTQQQAHQQKDQQAQEKLDQTSSSSSSKGKHSLVQWESISDSD